jgi:enoyl-CoA hydratase/carnithine racemase
MAALLDDDRTPGPTISLDVDFGTAVTGPLDVVAEPVRIGSSTATIKGESWTWIPARSSRSGSGRWTVPRTNRTDRRYRYGEDSGTAIMADVALDIVDGAAYLTVGREEKKNALDSKLRSETITPKIRECRQNDDVQVLVFQTEGDVFSTGGDLQELLANDYRAEAIKRIGESWEELHFQLLNLGKPTVAKVDGLALAGAANLLLYNDIVVATEDAQIGWSGVGWGIVEWFSSTRLQHYIGPRKAMYYLLTGELIDAIDAEAMGLVTKTVPSEELDATVDDIVDSLTDKHPRTLKRMREAVYRSMEMSPSAALEVTKRDVYDLNSSDPPLEEGIEAFLENRKPDWVR